MENRIYNEQNGLWYEKQGDYYIPCLTLPEEENQPIGVWGQRHARYLKEHRKVLYNGVTKLNIEIAGQITAPLSWIIYLPFSFFRKLLQPLSRCKMQAVKQSKVPYGCCRRSEELLHRYSDLFLPV